MSDDFRTIRQSEEFIRRGRPSIGIDYRPDDRSGGSRRRSETTLGRKVGFGHDIESKAGAPDEGFGDLDRTSDSGEALAGRPELALIPESVQHMLPASGRRDPSSHLQTLQGQRYGRIPIDRTVLTDEYGLRPRFSVTGEVDPVHLVGIVRIGRTMISERLVALRCLFMQGLCHGLMPHLSGSVS